MIVLDRIDHKILALLVCNGRITNQELAETVGLSPAACHRRHRRLEQDGFITGYRATLDRDALGLGQSIFMQITLESQGSEAISAFEKAISSCENVAACHLMTGEFDFLVHILARDTRDYERLHKEVLTALPGVSRVRSSFALRSVELGAVYAD